MAKRLHGLAILITALAPLLLLVVVGLATWVGINTVRSAATDYGEVVGAEIEEATAAFREVGAALSSVGVFVDGIANDVGSAIDGIGPIDPNVRLPVEPIVIPGKQIFDAPGTAFDVHMPTVTVLHANSFDLRIPGIDPLSQFMIEVDRAGQSIGADIENELRKMTAIPDPIATVRDETVALGAEIRSTFSTWLLVVLVAFAVVVAAWLTTRTGAVVADIRRGWAMLLGREPTVSVESLRAQLAAIERSLAQLA